MSAFGVQTTSEVIEGVKRRAFLPDTQEALPDVDILKFLNEELQDSLVPLILQFHQEYLVYIQNVTLLADVNNYKVPYRALGRKLRDVKYMDASSNLYGMTRIQPEDRNYFQQTGFNPYKAFYIQGDELVLTPGVGSTPVGSLVFAFFMKPNALVDEERTCKVVSFNENTGVITVDSVPTNITMNSNIDFIEYLPGNKTMSYDITVTAVDTVANTITVDPTDLPMNSAGDVILAVNDYICSAGESPVPQVPSELHSLLQERGAARCLASLGHTENLANSDKKIAELEQKSGSLIDNRTEGQPIKANNLGGILRQSKISRRRFYF